MVEVRCRTPTRVCGNPNPVRVFLASERGVGAVEELHGTKCRTPAQIFWKPQSNPTFVFFVCFQRGAGAVEERTDECSPPQER